MAFACRLSLRPARRKRYVLLKLEIAMAVSIPSLLTRLRTGRVRILWLMLGSLLLVSALPIALYHRQVLELSQEKLVDMERVQQTELTNARCRAFATNGSCSARKFPCDALVPFLSLPTAVR